MNYEFAIFILINLNSIWIKEFLDIWLTFSGKPIWETVFFFILFATFLKFE